MSPLQLLMASRKDNHGTVETAKRFTILAHLQHGVKRAVIFDIDLHHGNGTQSIVWQINEESYRQKIENEFNPNATNESGLQVFYGSIHDILSYPCEVSTQGLSRASTIDSRVGRQAGTCASRLDKYPWPSWTIH
jgi:acetoin utilization deacetylase AcuC-like enzyme